MTAKINFTSGLFGIDKLNLAEKKVAMPMPWFTQEKTHLNVMKVLVTDLFDNY